MIQYTRFAIAVKAFLIFTLILFLSLCVPRLHRSFPSTAFVGKPSGPRFHVVAAHYGTDPGTISSWIDELKFIPYVQELGVRLTYYTKGEHVDSDRLQQLTGADEVLTLPNVGREGETYLHHILKHYDDLPEFLFFTQSSTTTALNDVHTFDEEHRQFMQSSFKDSTGFMNLGEIHEGLHQHCDCGRCIVGFYPLLPQLYRVVTGKLCQTKVGSPGQTSHRWAQFIVSRDRIRQRPRWVYEYLHQLITAPEGHWLHDAKQPSHSLRFFLDGKSTPSNPLFGHTLETFWPILFGCEDVDAPGCEITLPGAPAIKYDTTMVPDMASTQDAIIDQAKEPLSKSSDSSAKEGYTETGVSQGNTYLDTTDMASHVSLGVQSKQGQVEEQEPLMESQAQEDAGKAL